MKANQQPLFMQRCQLAGQYLFAFHADGGLQVAQEFLAALAEYVKKQEQAQAAAQAAAQPAQPAQPVQPEGQPEGQAQGEAPAS